MKVQLQPAYLLHARPYSETSAILEQLTQDYGRVAVIAKGVRSNKSKRRFAIQHFSRNLISWNRKGELGLLTQIEPDPISTTSSVSSECIALGFYLNELVMRLTTRDDPSQLLFESYEMALIQLRQVEAQQRQAILRRFEVQLLDVIGYQLEWDRDFLNGHLIDPEISYSIDPEQGFTRSHKLIGTVRGASLLAIQSGIFDSEQSLKDAKMVMSQILAHHLGGRPLKSRELFYRSRKSNS